MLRYEGIVDVLFERVPGLIESEEGREAVSEKSRDLPYVVFGAFATYLNRLLSDPRTGESTSNPVIEASFQLLNEMGNSADPRLSNLAAVGVFEILTDVQASIRVARQLLYGRAIDHFEAMLQLWGIEVRTPETCGRGLSAAVGG